MRSSTFLLTALLGCSILGCSILVSTPALAGGRSSFEIGDPETKTDDPNASPHLNSLDLELDVGMNYTAFTGSDMKDTYTGLPQLQLGVSMALGPAARAFLAVRYGSVDGDPYYGLGLNSDTDALTLRSLPFLLGLKGDVSGNSRLRFWFSAALMLGWVEEENHAENWSVSGFSSGFMLSVGPEVLVGHRHRIGLEIGWGGTKADLRDEQGSRHDVDLVGYQGRIYYAFAWKGDSK